MKKIIITLTCLTFNSAQIYAQEITASPICFTLRNEAPYKVYGTISTKSIKDENGKTIHHSGTFRLDRAGATHPKKGYPTDVTEFCSSGPFFQGRQLDLTLKALFPIFSCKTNIELGEVIIKGIHKEDGTTRTWADCY